MWHGGPVIRTCWLQWQCFSLATMVAAQFRAAAIICTLFQFMPDLPSWFGAPDSPTFTVPAVSGLAKGRIMLWAQSSVTEESLSVFNTLGTYMNTYKEKQGIYEQVVEGRQHGVGSTSIWPSVVHSPKQSQGQRENWPGVVQAIGKKLGCPTVATDIDAAHRVPAKDRTLYDSCPRARRPARPGWQLLRWGGRKMPSSSLFVSENQRLFAQALTLSQDPKFAPTSAQLGLARLGIFT